MRTQGDEDCGPMIGAVYGCEAVWDSARASLGARINSVRHNSCGGGVRRSRYTIDSYATCTDAYPSCKTEGHRHGALPSALAVRGDPPRVQIFSPAGPAL